MIVYSSRTRNGDHGRRSITTKGRHTSSPSYHLPLPLSSLRGSALLRRTCRPTLLYTPPKRKAPMMEWIQLDLLSHPRPPSVLDQSSRDMDERYSET